MGILGFGSFRDKFTIRYNRKLTDSTHGYVACFDITPIVVNALKISSTGESFALNFTRGMTECNELIFLRTSRPTILRYTLDNKSPKAKRQTQLRRMLDVPIVCRTARDFSVLEHARMAGGVSPYHDLDDSIRRVEEAECSSLAERNPPNRESRPYGFQKIPTELSFASKFKKTCSEFKKLRIIDVVGRIENILLYDSAYDFAKIALNKTEFDYDEGEGEIKAINWLMDQRRYKTKLIMSRDNDVYIYVLSKLMTNPAIVVSSINLLVYHERSNDVLSCWRDFECHRSKCWAFILWLSICFGNDYATGVLTTNLDSIDTYFVLLKKLFFEISNFIRAYDADTRIFYSDLSYAEKNRVEEKGIEGGGERSLYEIVNPKTTTVLLERRVADRTSERTVNRNVPRANIDAPRSDSLKRESKRPSTRSKILDSSDDSRNFKRVNFYDDSQICPISGKFASIPEIRDSARKYDGVNTAAEKMDVVLASYDQRKNAVSRILNKFIESRIIDGGRLSGVDDDVGYDADRVDTSEKNKVDDDEENLERHDRESKVTRCVWLRRAEILNSTVESDNTLDSGEIERFANVPKISEIFDLEPNRSSADGSLCKKSRKNDDSNDNFSFVENKKPDRSRDAILAITDAIVTLQKILNSVRYADKYKINFTERNEEKGSFGNEREDLSSPKKCKKIDSNSVNVQIWLTRHLWSLLYSIELPKYFKNNASFRTIPSIKIDSAMPMPFVSKDTFLSLSKLEIENFIKTIMCHGVR